MTTKKELKPDYIFECSWEVCNRVGGIYTVLSTKALTLQNEMKDRVIFIGPDFWGEKKCPFFKESKTLMKDWKWDAIEQDLPVKVGRWDIPGQPIAILVDFHPYLRPDIKNTTYARAWELNNVNSIAAYGDYDEASMFGLAAGRVIESLYKHLDLQNSDKNVVAHFNEWMTAFGLFYLRNRYPDIATVFTTHATSIGRSIAGNGKPLYGYLGAYNGDQMARELNMVAKHSAEKEAAIFADGFTTVSDVTAKECKQLLDKAPDVVTPNGFENGFVPATDEDYKKKHKAARDLLTKVAEKLFGYQLVNDTIFVGTSGRYEYKNKGIDLFIDSLKRLSEQTSLTKDVVGFIMVPAKINGPRLDLKNALADNNDKGGLSCNYVTHDLTNFNDDIIINAIKWYGFENKVSDKVKIIFIPSYLNGDDGIFNKEYYDLLIGLDLTIFPSYYEPWGYTPLESIAFSIPTITTDLSGFGQWVMKAEKNKKTGVTVVHRTDYNYREVKNAIYAAMFEFAQMSLNEREKIGKNAKDLSQLALWKNFIAYYKETYNFALHKAHLRKNKIK